MLGELRGNLVEDRYYLVGYLPSIIEDVVTIYGKHIALGSIYGIKVLGLNILLDGLWHSSNNHVETESIHSLTMESLAHRLPLCVHLLYQVHQHVIACGPKELFKVHRVHLDGAFFRGEYNALSILLDAHQRSRLDIVISTISHQKFDRSSSPRTIEALALGHNCTSSRMISDLRSWSFTL